MLPPNCKGEYSKALSTVSSLVVTFIKALFSAKLLTGASSSISDLNAGIFKITNPSVATASL